MAPKAKKAPKARAMPKEDPMNQKVNIVNVFRQWDTNHDGLISIEEMTSVLSSIGVSEKEMQAAFERADTNRDGKVDYDEFATWLFDCAPKEVEDLVSKCKAPPNDEVEGQKRLDDMLAEVFKCFDLDKDGLLERVELLDVSEKLYKKLNDLFSVKSRREVVQWFKDAGAEGTPTDGMYLSYEKWKVAYLDALKKRCGCTAGEPSVLADYLFKHVAEPLFEITYPKGKGSGAVASDEPPADMEILPPPPTYPITVQFKDFHNACSVAANYHRVPLVLSCDAPQVETFMEYKGGVQLDCKQLIGEMYVKKAMSKEDAQEQASNKLKNALNSRGFCIPLHIRMNNTAFDWNGFCSPGKFPKEVFSPSLWTPEEALKAGLIDVGHKNMVEIEDLKRWKDFQVVITSTFDLERANNFLFDKIPHYDELAIIVIDPKSLD